MKSVQVLRLPKADLPTALCRGRQAVDSKYFLVLDDDDYLLPGALKTRLDLLVENPQYDAVITNGVVLEDGIERPFAADMLEFSSDSLAALGRRNWLSPGSALIRADRVPADVFIGIPQYLEWTYIAIRLATRGRLLFSNAATFVYNADAPDKVSRSDAYLFGQPSALDRLLSLELPDPLRHKLERDRAMAFHGIANRQLQHREFRRAWRAHVSSLFGRGGLQFLPFTRKLLGFP
jgi:glycosyltransferase involved in cell wall biosynthesis